MINTEFFLMKTALGATYKSLSRQADRKETHRTTHRTMQEAPRACLKREKKP